MEDLQKTVIRLVQDRMQMPQWVRQSWDYINLMLGDCMICWAMYLKNVLIFMSAIQITENL